MKILQIQKLSSHFEQQQVLQGLELSVAPNEIVCLLGASGCGKTTLLKSIAGLQPISSGKIYLAQQDLAQIPIEKRKIGLIFQDYALFPHLNVKENIQFGLQHLAKEQAEQISQQMLSLVKLLGLEQRFPHELSGGQQQRVAIARALANQPSLLLLDEPFSNIDTQTRYEMIKEIKQILKSQQVPAIFVTHSKEEAFAFADKIAVMAQGKILQFGTGQQLYQQPNSPFVADFLGGSNYLPCQVKQGKLHSAVAELDVNAVDGEHFWLLRPEQLQIGVGDAQALVCDRLFLGQYYRYQLRLNDCDLFCYAHAEFEIGTWVKLQLREQVSRPILFSADEFGNI